MHDTRFVDPTGLSPNNVSSARGPGQAGARRARLPADPRVLDAPTAPRSRRAAGSGRLPQHQRPGAHAHWEIDLSKTGYISDAGRCLVMQVRAGVARPDRGAARLLGQVLADRRRATASASGSRAAPRASRAARPHAGATARSFPRAACARTSSPGCRSRRSRSPPSTSTTRAGSRLFERICRLPEYYPTRAELAHHARAPRARSRASPAPAAS